MTTIGHPSVPRPPVRPVALIVVAFVLGWPLDRIVEFEIDGAGAGTVQQAVAALLLVAGSAFAGWSFATFNALGTAIMPDRPVQRLVITGPYRYSRNPMFVGFVGIYLGLAALLNMAWPIVLLPAAMLLLNATVIRQEEDYLDQRFGGAFHEYSQRVRRWL